MANGGGTRVPASAADAVAEYKRVKAEAAVNG